MRWSRTEGVWPRDVQVWMCRCDLMMWVMDAFKGSRCAPRHDHADVSIVFLIPLRSFKIQVRLVRAMNDCVHSPLMTLVRKNQSCVSMAAKPDRDSVFCMCLEAECHGQRCSIGVCTFDKFKRKSQVSCAGAGSFVFLATRHTHHKIGGDDACPEDHAHDTPDWRA